MTIGSTEESGHLIVSGSLCDIRGLGVPLYCLLVHSDVGTDAPNGIGVWVTVVGGVNMVGGDVIITGLPIVGRVDVGVIPAAGVDTIGVVVAAG